MRSHLRKLRKFKVRRKVIVMKVMRKVIVIVMMIVMKSLYHRKDLLLNKLSLRRSKNHSKSRRKEKIREKIRDSKERIRDSKEKETKVEGDTKGTQIEAASRTIEEGEEISRIEENSTRTEERIIKDVDRYEL